MPNTQTIDALRQELWSKTLFDDVARGVTDILGFSGEGANNIIQVSRELSKRKGDTETFGLVTRLTGDGIDGDSELEGNEEALSSYAEQVAIDQKRHAVRLTGKLDAQKVTYDQIKVGRDMLQIWMSEFMVRQIMLKAGGVTNTTLVDTESVGYSANATWSNTPDFIPDADTAAGSGNRYLNVSGGSAASMTAADTMTLDFVTDLQTKAKLSNPKIQPLLIDGKKYYVLYLHPLCARDIRKSSDWKTAQENAKVRADKNPVFGDAVGIWSNVIIKENEFVPWLDVSAAGNSFRGAASGTNFAVDTARNLFCGRQAVLMAEASNPKALVAKRFDYENKDGVAISFIGGLQKAMFNSKEFGVIAADVAASV